jgi:hypothetical protein
MLSIAAKRRLPNLIDLTRDLVIDTASLSNIGVLEPLGAAVEAVWFSPPGRMPLGVHIGIATHADRLHLALRCSHAQFDARAAHAFGRLYREVLPVG